MHFFTFNINNVSKIDVFFVVVVFTMLSTFFFTIGSKRLVKSIILTYIPRWSPLCMTEHKTKMIGSYFVKLATQFDSTFSNVLFPTTQNYAISSEKSLYNL